MKKLVTYFSVSGTTEKLAEDLAKAIEGDIYKIEPKIPYTDADLNWRDKNSRSSVEMADENSRPEIVENNPKIADYDVIFVGFPIWWYTAPSIIHTFLETYDFSNKKIVVFATSGSSDLGNTINDKKKFTGNS